MRKFATGAFRRLFRLRLLCVLVMLPPSLMPGMGCKKRRQRKCSNQKVRGM